MLIFSQMIKSTVGLIIGVKFYYLRYCPLELFLEARYILWLLCMTSNYSHANAHTQSSLFHFHSQHSETSVPNNFQSKQIEKNSPFQLLRFAMNQRVWWNCIMLAYPARLQWFLNTDHSLVSLCFDLKLASAIWGRLLSKQTSLSLWLRHWIMLNWDFF